MVYILDQLYMRHMENKKLSVIIVSFVNISILKDCLDSIKKYNDIGDALEVIVSDNSPTYDLVNRIHAEYSWVTIIKNENIGFGAGNNRGAEISKGDYLLFLNPDTVLIEPIFQFAIDKFYEDSDLGLFGVQLVSRNLKKTYSFFMMDREGIFSLLQSRWHYFFNTFSSDKMFISGADLFVRRTSFEEAGMFDENIFMYKEEPDLTKRIKSGSKSNKICYFKEKKIVHLEGGTDVKDESYKIKFAKRLVETDKYYCHKYGLQLQGVLKQKLRRSRFKIIILTLFFRRHRARIEKEVYHVYKEALINSR